MNIVADLHTHTLASGHAYSTLSENIGAAKEAGLLFLGVCDHAPALPGAPHENYFKNLKVIRRDWEGLTVLRSAELNILDEFGKVDLSESIQSELDYTIASLHYPTLAKDKHSRCTDAAIAAMGHPSVFILGHPDDDLLPLDYKAVVPAAKRAHVALEVNNSSLVPGSFRKGAADNYRKMLKLAKEQDARIILSSDSHIAYDVGNVQLALALLHELNFPPELVINSSAERFFDFWKCRRSAAQPPRAAKSS